MPVTSGATLSFVVSWFFQLKSFTIHAWMTAFFAALLGLEIHLLIIMNHPYRGSLGVSPEAFTITGGSGGMTPEPSSIMLFGFNTCFAKDQRYGARQTTVSVDKV